MPREKLVILFIAADTDPDSYKRMGDAHRAIAESLNLAKLRDLFDLVVSPPVRYSDLQGLLLKHRPHIVHLCISVNPAGTVELEDALGKVRQVDPSALAALFAVLPGRVRCVVLDAGRGSPGAPAIAKSIDFVVGFPEGVQGQALVDFAAGFYCGLGYGQAVHKAYKMGCVEMRLGGCALEAKLLGKLKADTQVVLLDELGEAPPQAGTTVSGAAIPPLPAAGLPAGSVPPAVSRDDNGLAALLDQVRAAATAGAVPVGPPALLVQPATPPLDTVRVLKQFDLVQPSVEFTVQVSQLAAAGIAGFALAGDRDVIDLCLRPRMVAALKDTRGREPSTTDCIPLLASDLDAAATPLEAVERKLNSAFATLLSQERVDRLLVISSHGVPPVRFAAFADGFMADAETRFGPLALTKRNLLIVVWVYSLDGAFAAQRVRLLAPALQIDPTFDVESYIRDRLTEAQVPPNKIQWCVDLVLDAVRSTGGRYADIVVQLRYALAQVCH